MNPNKIIVHCSASDNHRYDFRLICKDHIRRGFTDIGYHFGIEPDGRIQILREIDRPGAHTKGYNSESIGICLMGLETFSVDQFKSLADVVAMLMAIYKIRPDDIYPHNEFNKDKTCPNFDLEEWKILFLEKRLVARTYCDR